jgi:hypothetical protein
MLRSPRLSRTLASGANDARRRFTCHLGSTHQATVLAQDLCYSDPSNQVLTFLTHTRAVRTIFRVAASSICAHFGVP